MKSNRREFIKMTCMTGIGLVGTNIFFGNDIIRLRGEHLSNLRGYIRNGLRRPYPNSAEYGEKYEKAKDALCARILHDRDAKVVIVNTMDDLCKSGACPKVGEECLTLQLANKDRGVAALFGLSLDREYTTQEIVTAMWESPENEKYEELKQEVIKKAFGK